MSTPNMKSFCIAVVQPYIRSVIDFFQSAIDYIEGKQTLQDDKIQDMLAANTDMQNRVKKAETTVSNMSKDLQQMRKDFDEASDFASLETIKSTVKQHTTQIKSLQDGLANVPNDIAALEKKVTANTKNITTNASNISTNKQNIATVKTTATENKKDITSMLNAFSSCTLFDTNYPFESGDITWNNTKYKPFTNSFNKTGVQ